MQTFTGWEGFMHWMAIPWKILFAVIPPVSACGGWITYFCALIMTAGVCFLISEIATACACLLNIHSGVLAITIIAVGFSLPDLYASQLAAESTKTTRAEPALGYIAASSAVKVFIGLGLPWTIATVRNYTRMVENIPE
jgi:Ca2+/Na+ antiporter